jgi:sensor histidine kinase YesM
MGLIKRSWEPHEAEEWTREDWIAIVLSPLSYIFLTIGLAMSIFLLTTGFVFLILGIIMIVIMFWVIDPKIKTISTEYEKKQRQYLEDLEHIQRWEEPE